jgi:orotidine-5'-phosphate decarboxylase
MVGAIEKYNNRTKKVDSFLCAGLDSPYPQFEFNKKIIDATHEYVSAYKPNFAFYEAGGDKGFAELKKTVEYLQKKHPDILTIADAKRADIGSTSEQYAKSIFDWFGFDAVTLNPYLGKDALQPFLDYKDKGCIVLCYTSNPGAGEFQGWGQPPLWQFVAKKVHDEWNEHENCMLVVGATYPEEIKAVRGLVGDMTLLIPGIGAQGGTVKTAVQAGLNSQKQGIIISTGRAILFADDPAEAARSLRDEIREAIAQSKE